MATNEILQFANTASGAEILSQAAYAADPDRPDGHDPGTIARAELENKVLLQTSTIAAAVAQFMADSQANNITDAVAIATLAEYLKTSIRNVSLLFTIAGGTADALTAAFTPATTALADGKFMVIRATGANTLTNPTLAADGLAAKTIVKGNNSALALNDIPGAGFYALITYNPALDKYVLNNPASGTGGGGGSLGFLHVQDRKASGVAGGSAVGGVNADRALAYEAINTISATQPGGSPALWNIPAGTYKVSGSFPAYDVNAHRTVMFNASTSAVLLLGTVENTATTDMSRSLINGIVTFASTTQIVVKHGFQQSRSGDGLGVPFGGAQDELYSELMFEKIA